MDWKIETISHLWIVSEIDLSGNVVDGTYPLEGKKWKLNTSRSHLYKNDNIKTIFLPPRIPSCFLLEELYP